MKVNKMGLSDKIKTDIKNAIYYCFMLGLYYGYPVCCIEYFVYYLNYDNTNKNQKYKPLCLKISNSSGFIPCPIHAKEINKGLAKIEYCINSRRCKQPSFPNGVFDEAKFKEKYEEYKKIADFYIINYILKNDSDYNRYHHTIH